MPVRQLRQEELEGIWPQVAAYMPYDSFEEFEAFASNALELMICDPRGPALGLLLLVPWKERRDVLQIVTPRRKMPGVRLLEHTIEISDTHKYGLITPLAGAWNLRHYRRFGFRPLQRILSFMKADYILPPPIEWVGVELLRKCAGEDELRKLDEMCFVPFWQLSQSELRKTIESDLALGLHSGGRLLGYVSAVLYGRQASIGRLAVHPDFRRQGIGSGLLRQMIKIINQKGIGEVGVTTQEENIPARRLYQSFGFYFNGEFEMLGYPYPREHDHWGL